MYDATFLPATVPLPDRPEGVALRTLEYEHFTVQLDPVRRLAAATAVNIDGAALVDLGRGDDWHLDPRVPADEQTGAAVYAANDLDRGHLVRRRDPVWGDRDAAERANLDTFSYTNAAPQAGGFNQSKQLWLGLEDYVLENASASGRRLSVFTGPVLGGSDPVYRGTGIPLRFWKIAAWWSEAAAELRATGYLLDQSELVADYARVGGERNAAAEPPELGEYRTFQVPIDDIAALTGLTLDVLVAADRWRAPEPAVPGSPWRRLHDEGDIQLGDS
jgi:endonuclease G